MAREGHADLIGASALALLVDLWVATRAPGTPLGVLLGVPLLGYALVLAAFPRASTMRPLDRASLGLLGGLACVPLLGLAANRTPWSLSLAAFSLAHAASVLVFSSIAALRLRRIEPGERLSPAWLLDAVRCDLASFRAPPVAIVVCTIGFVAFVSAAASVLPALHDRAEFSELLVVPAGGNLTDVPRELPAGSTFAFTVIVTNQHPDERSYHTSVVAERGAPASDHAAFSGLVTRVDERDAKVAPSANATLDFVVSLVRTGTWRIQVTSTDASDGSALEAHMWIEVRP